MLPTAILLQQFHKIYPRDRLVFALGSDNIKSIQEWEFFEEVLSKWEYVVFFRDVSHEDEIKKILPNSEIIWNHTPRSLSST